MGVGGLQYGFVSMETCLSCSVSGGRLRCGPDSSPARMPRHPQTGLSGRHQQFFFFFNHRQLKASYILYTSSIAGTPNSNGYFIIKLYVFCI